MLGWLTGAAVLGGAGAYSYGAMAPQSQLFGASFARGADPQQLALTYDDGPNDSSTLPLLEVLAKYGVKATFFLIGRHVRSRPAIARKIAEAGHAIGNHTYSHPNLIFASLKKLRRELEICERVLTETIGEHARLFRPPFGAKRPAILRTVHSMGFKPIKWSVTCYDWKPTTAERVERHAVDEMLIQHLLTERLIRRYHDQGYKFVTIPEMMQASEG